MFYFSYSKTGILQSGNNPGRHHTPDSTQHETTESQYDTTSQERTSDHTEITSYHFAEKVGGKHQKGSTQIQIASYLFQQRYNHTRRKNNACSKSPIRRIM